MKAYELLRKMILNHGVEILSNRTRCKGIINDLFQNKFSKEKNLIFSAFDEDIVDELLGDPNNLKTIIPRLVEKLVYERGLQKINAQWAVCSWAYAIGFIDNSVLRQCPIIG